MKILVVNAGSSSLKFQLIESDGEHVLSRGLYDGLSKSSTHCIRVISAGNDRQRDEIAITAHDQAVDDMLDILSRSGIVGPTDTIAATAHRVVHGGERFSGTVRIGESELQDLFRLSGLAPLHNPVNSACLEMMMRRLPDAAHYAIFDTAFHQTMPEEAFIYGLPYDLYKRFAIRKYGFHGSNHKYVALRAAEMIGLPAESLRIITCHLGNGQSICAVLHGKSVDTSMGFTPLEGLPMGTRSGSFDPDIIFFLLDNGYRVEEIRQMLHRESGLLGLSGISSDYRTIMEEASKGNPGALRTHRIMVHRITGLIGAYIAEMEGVDGIVFTGGIGENSPALRSDILSHFNYAGMKVDSEKNMSNSEIISTDESSIAALVIPANEELQIVREVMEARQNNSI
ncbi:MAG: acetate kinase [Spirochaetes bacterium]|nr:acetate kinase [Spirochaetota bacterium]